MQQCSELKNYKLSISNGNSVTDLIKSVTLLYTIEMQCNSSGFKMDGNLNLQIRSRCVLIKQINIWAGYHKLPFHSGEKKLRGWLQVTLSIDPSKKVTANFQRQGFLKTSNSNNIAVCNCWPYLKKHLAVTLLVLMMQIFRMIGLKSQNATLENWGGDFKSPSQ